MKNEVDFFSLLQKENISIENQLAFGKFDIYFSITLLKIILEKVNAMQMNPRELHFTLSTSIQKMLSMLEVEAYKLSKK